MPRPAVPSTPLSEPDPAAVCVTCGAPLDGAYCAVCGERRAAARDLSLAGFVRHAVQSVTSVDSRTVRSLRLLITRPGLLTAEFVRGRRRPYLSPLQLFLVANIIFFIAEPFLPVVTLDTPLSVHLSSDAYGELATRLVRERFIDAEAVDYEAYAARFNYVAHQHAKSLFIILAPLFAAAVALLRVGRREPAGQHIGFALHLMAFMMLLFVLISIALALARLLLPEGALPGDHWLIPGVVITALMAHLYLSYRRAYAAGRATAVVLAALTAVLILPGLDLYRFLLFFTVFFTV